MLLKRAYTKDEFKQFLSMTPFKKYNILEKEIGFEVWLEKTPSHD